MKKNVSKFQTELYGKEVKMKISDEQNELNYEQIWRAKFWTPLIDSEHFALTEQDIKTLYDFGYKLYKIGGYRAATKFFTEQLEILTKGGKKCQNSTKLKSASGFLSLLGHLLSCFGLLKKLWKSFR